MASDLVKRLIAANENSIQAVNGSDIFYKAAERIDFLEEENERLSVSSSTGLACRELIAYWQHRARHLKEEPIGQLARVAAIELEDCAKNLAKVLDGKATEATGFKAS